MYDPNIISKYTIAAFLSNGVDLSNSENPDGSIDSDSYVKILLKLIPSEIIVFYISSQNILLMSDFFLEHKYFSFVNYFIWLFLTPFFGKHLKKISAKFQIYFSMVAFIAWSFIVGSPFDIFVNDLNGFGIWLAIILCAFYSIIPKFYFKDEKK